MKKQSVIDSLGSIPIEDNNFYKIDRSRINKNNPLFVSEYFYSKNNIKDFEKNNKINMKEMKAIEKEKEIEKLENYYLKSKKFDVNHIEKITNLLYNSKDKNYSIKRKNLNHTIFSYDDKNNLYLTLDDFFKEQNKDKIYKNKDNQCKNKNNYKNNNSKTNNNNNSNENEKKIFLKMEEDEQAKLYEILKTKENFSQFNTKVNFIPMNQKYYSTQLTENNENKLYNNNLTDYYQTNNTETNLYKKSNYLNKSNNFPLHNYKNNETYYFNPKKLTVNQRKQMTYLGQLTVFKDIRKIREKNKILNHIHNRDKKEILPLIDVFHYDKKRWDNKRVEEDIDKFNEIQDKKNFLNRKEKISNMVEDSNKIKTMLKDLKKIERKNKKNNTRIMNDIKAFDLNDFKFNKRRRPFTTSRNIYI